MLLCKCNLSRNLEVVVFPMLVCELVGQAHWKTHKRPEKIFFSIISSPKNLNRSAKWSRSLLFQTAPMLALQPRCVAWCHCARFGLLQRGRLNFIQLTLNPGNLLKTCCFNATTPSWVSVECHCRESKRTLHTHAHSCYWPLHNSFSILVWCVYFGPCTQNRLQVVGS